MYSAWGKLYCILARANISPKDGDLAEGLCFYHGTSSHCQVIARWSSHKFWVSPMPQHPWTGWNDWAPGFWSSRTGRRIFCPWMCLHVTCCLKDSCQSVVHVQYELGQGNLEQQQRRERERERKREQPPSRMAWQTSHNMPERETFLETVTWKDWNKTKTHESSSAKKGKIV